MLYKAIKQKISNLYILSIEIKSKYKYIYLGILYQISILELFQNNNDLDHYFPKLFHTLQNRLPKLFPKAARQTAPPKLLPKAAIL